MSAVGYEFLRTTLGLTALPPRAPARSGPVSRVERLGDALVVPAPVVPGDDDPLSHLLFALKHEGTDLAILTEALRRIPGRALRDALTATPGGGYIRKACFLWEHANGAELQDLPPVSGAAVPLFDPARYVTSPGLRHPRWKVHFNGLGSLEWCATVERTPEIEALMAADLPGRANAYAAELGSLVRDRALAWAYLHETRDSFAIERETPSEDRARAFVALLHQAHERQALTEEYLTGLQQATVANPFDRAVGFRQEQNWLQGPLRGAAGVTYVPPPPGCVEELMDGLMTFANEQACSVDPLVAAGVVSFGFVFIHPYMDGNGRLSRFLFHHALCRSGALNDGLILPVSVAMKKEEAGYLQVLQHYSRPVRDRWDVDWLDEGEYAFRYRGDPQLGIYRYWDATEVVAFGMRMAARALEVELKQETAFLACYDAVVREVEQQFDLRGSDLSTLVLSALDNGGRISRRRRDQFQSRVPHVAFDFIEQAAATALTQLDTDH